MFVSLKNRVFAVIALAGALLFVLGACGDDPSQEAELRSEVPVTTTTVVLEPPQQPDPPEVSYSLRANWPNIIVDGVLSYQTDGDLCVDTVACVPAEDAFVKAAYFVGNAFTHKDSLSNSKTEAELVNWRKLAVTNVCFMNSWDAYVGGALLFFAYDDDADVSDYAAVMRSFDSCDKADVLQQPQP